MKTVLLQGPPGSGKTTMVCETAINRPIHVIDVDRKLASMQRVQAFIEKGDITWWEVNVPLANEDLAARAIRLDKNEKPASSPMGWLLFAKYAKQLESAPEAQAAGTWFLDSATALARHLKMFILFHDQQGHSTMSDRNYGTFLQMWNETMTVMIDGAKKYNKDLIVSVHERSSEIPTVGAKVIKSKDTQGVMRREYLGPMDAKIAASIDGQFGQQIGTFFEEVYGLSVIAQGVNGTGMPKWICRVLPDGIRDLRTSYRVTQPEFTPDFRAIWK